MGIAVSTPGRVATNNDAYSPNIPNEYQGILPVHEPTLNGFERVLLLDDEWLVIVSDTVPDVIAEIDTLSGGVFQGYIDAWVAGDHEGNPNFTDRSNNLWATRDLYIAEARQTVENPLAVAANFTITSSDDSNYSGAGQNPDQCAKVHMSKGKWRDWERPVQDGTFVLHWLIYSYIQLPTRMVNGSTYTITHSNGDSATILYDLNATVSMAIKVNQSGYLSSAGTKKAIVGAHLFDFGVMDISHASTYEIINTATQAVAHSGNLSLVESNPQQNPQIETGTTTATTANKLVDSGQNFTTTVSIGDRVYNTTDGTQADVTAVDSDTTLSISADRFTIGEAYEIRKVEADVDTSKLYGEDVYEIDFSAMTDTGEFFIKIPGIGRSWPFKHGTDAYNEAFYTACRGLFHQRAGVPIKAANSHWPRQTAVTHPWYECDMVDFPVHSTNTVTVDSGGHSASDTLSQTATSGSGTGFSITVDTDNLSGGSIINGQDQTDFDNSPTSEGTFSGGTGHAAGDVLGITGGGTITVDAVSAGVVTEFTVNNTGYTEFTAVQETISYASYTKQQPGGWHDAADFDLRGHHYTVVFDLLYAYAFNSSKLTDSQLEVPESGNGIPDILSEVKHGLSFWLATMNGSGGVSGDLETWTHPTIDATDNAYTTNFYYALSQRTRHNSLMFAAAAAMYAQYVAAHDASEATTWTTHATDAYAFGTNSANSLGTTAIGKHLWIEDDDHINPYLMHAKLRLYLRTGTASYLSDAPSISTLETAITGTSDGGVEPYNWRFTRYDWSPWIFYSIIEAYDAGATSLSALASTWTTWFTADADTLIDDYLAKNPYPLTLPRNISVGIMRWGNAHPSNWNRSLAIAHQITGTAKYKDAMSQNMDWEFGVNPMGICWTTGIGYVYPIDLQNWVSDYDGRGDPVPGITVYGITGDDQYAGFGWQVWEEEAASGGVISSLTQSGGTATAVCSVAHGLTTGDPIAVQGATQTEYNTYGHCTATNTTTFTYTVDSGADATATGSPIWHHNFVESSAERSRPKWRKWFCHPTLNVVQNEYTVDNTMSAVTFSCAYLMGSGFSPDGNSMKRPRADKDLHGNYHLL